MKPTTGHAVVSTVCSSFLITSLFILNANCQSDESEIKARNEVLYDDVHEWNERENSFCGNDKQSPIDIDTDDTKKESSKCDEFEWDIDTDHRTFNVTNNGIYITLVKLCGTFVLCLSVHVT